MAETEKLTTEGLAALLGKQVTGTSLPNPDADDASPARRPQQVQGILTRRWVETLGYWRYFAGGEGVDESTIKPLEKGALW